MRRILVTGGAGFIGSHLSKALLDGGWEVTVYDSLSSQVHGAVPSVKIPDGVNFIRGDVCDARQFQSALEGQEVVVHLAAETGTGQSMYEVIRYQQVNIGGTALLMDLVAHQRNRTVKKIVVASSRAVYGEGAYRCSAHGTVYPSGRSLEDMQAFRFELRCPICHEFCEPIPTGETSPFNPTSYYGITKQAQEQTVLTMAASLGIAAYALRYQNVFGPGQSLKNPYTGILAVFSNLARAGKPINVFEDGIESRDFVYVSDVVDATLRSIDRSGVGIDRFNVGSGARVTVEQVARKVADFFESDSTIAVSGEFRRGDIRHNIADLSYVRRELGYEPAWNFERGVAEFLGWAAQNPPADNGFSRSMDELRTRGLLMNISLK